MHAFLRRIFRWWFHRIDAGKPSSICGHDSDKRARRVLTSCGVIANCCVCPRCPFGVQGCPCVQGLHVCSLMFATYMPALWWPCFQDSVPYSCRISQVAHVEVERKRLGNLGSRRIWRQHIVKCRHCGDLGGGMSMADRGSPWQTAGKEVVSARQTAGRPQGVQGRPRAGMESKAGHRQGRSPLQAMGRGRESTADHG